MFRHIVLYKLRDPAFAEETVRRFRSMPAHIPCILSLEAGADELRSERSCDVYLSMTFASRADMEAYKAHPYHAEFVKPFVHSVTVSSVSADGEV